MITIDPAALHVELKMILGEERAHIVSLAATTELQRTEAWVEMSMREFELLNVSLHYVEEEFTIDGQTYKSRPIRRGGRIAGHRVYKLHRSDNLGRVIRGWFGRILKDCWVLIDPSPEEREAAFSVINNFVQRELTNTETGRHI